jgi:Na+-driven multidrug efflux pump
MTNPWVIAFGALGIGLVILVIGTVAHSAGSKVQERASRGSGFMMFLGLLAGGALILLGLVLSHAGPWAVQNGVPNPAPRLPYHPYTPSVDRSWLFDRP